MKEKDLLKFSTAGSVDDGKSTLIGRLLYDSGSLPLDQIEALEKKAEHKGDDQINLAEITDGLKAEREQGITIDVAYRYFSTELRKFIIADTPGHLEYTRNMVTGTSTSDATLILVDARNGIVDQSRRHALVASLLGVKHLVVCVNKMDLVNYSKEVFDDIQTKFLFWAEQLDVEKVSFIPISALKGDNVVRKSENTNWYKGVSLLDTLNTLEIKDSSTFNDLRVSVQHVDKLAKGSNLALIHSLVLHGEISQNEEVAEVVSGNLARVNQLFDLNGEALNVPAPLTTKIVLDSDIGVKRGDLLAKIGSLPKISHSLTANVCWMGQEPLKIENELILQLGTKQALAHIEKINYVLDPLSFNKDELRSELRLNDIAEVKIRTSEIVAYDTYKESKKTGSFILIDPKTKNTVAGGMII